MTECRLPVTYIFKDARKNCRRSRLTVSAEILKIRQLYKAQTGAQKALLKRFGFMAEETDDPEWDGSDEAPASETLDDVAPRRIPRREQPIRDFEVKAIVEGCSQTGKSIAEISAGHVRPLQRWTKSSKLKRWQFKDASGVGNRTEPVPSSPKPQAAPALQASLPLPKPAPSFEMRVGGKTETVQPKTGSYAL